MRNGRSFGVQETPGPHLLQISMPGAASESTKEGDENRNSKTTQERQPVGPEPYRAHRKREERLWIYQKCNAAPNAGPERAPPRRAINCRQVWNQHQRVGRKRDHCGWQVKRREKAEQ